jgi:hypothetical protein
MPSELSRLLTKPYKNSGALVRQWTIPTERPPLVSEVVSTLADRGCRLVSATNPHGRSFRFSRSEPLLLFQVSPQLSSRGRVDPVPDPVLLRKSGSAGNRTRDLWICSQEFWPIDHRGGFTKPYIKLNKIKRLPEHGEGWTAKWSGFQSW